MEQCKLVFYLYQNYCLVQGPIGQENCWSPPKVSGPSQDEFIEYMIYNTKMQWVFVLKFGDSEMLLVQGTIYIVKLLVFHQIYWSRIAISNTGVNHVYTV